MSALEIPDEMLPLFQSVADGYGVDVLEVVADGVTLMALVLAIRADAPSVPLTPQTIELVRTLQAPRVPKRRPSPLAGITAAVH